MHSCRADPMALRPGTPAACVYTQGNEETRTRYYGLAHPLRVYQVTEVWPYGTVQGWTGRGGEKGKDGLWPSFITYALLGKR